MVDDRRQLQGQAVLHDFRQRVTVDGFGIVIAHIHQFFIGAGNLRVVGFPLFRQWFQDFALLRNLSRIGDDDLDSLFLWEIAEFIQHFLGGTDVHRRVGLDFPRLLPVRKKDVSISLVLCKHIMSVRRGAAGHTRLIGDVDDLAVQVLQVFFCIHIGKFIVGHQEFIIS